MKLKEKLANEAAEKDDSDHGEENILFQKGFLAGFDKAIELVVAELNNRADWAFEGVNQGEITWPECLREELFLKTLSRAISRLGEKETQ